MPTIITRYVDTRSPAGGNGTTPSTGSGDANRAYPNLSASLATQYNIIPDLTGSDSILKIECAGTIDSASNSSAQLRIPPFSTDYTRYVWVTANSASRHTGTIDYNKYIIANFGGNTAVILAVDDIKVLKLEGLQIENRSTNGIWNVINAVAPADSQLTIDRCIIRSVSASTNPGNGISLPGVVKKSLRLSNTIIQGNFIYGIQHDYAQSGSQPSYYYNNTIQGFTNAGIYVGQHAPEVQVYIKNNMLSGSANCLVTSSNTTASTNITSDATSTQANLRNITPNFVNASVTGSNFQLYDRNAPGVNQGTNLSADSIYAFTTDIAGTTRASGATGQSWDIGAFEYVRPASNLLVPTITTVHQSDFTGTDGVDIATLSPTVGNPVTFTVGAGRFKVANNRAYSSGSGTTYYTTNATASFPFTVTFSVYNYTNIQYQNIAVDMPTDGGDRIAVYTVDSNGSTDPYTNRRLVLMKNGSNQLYVDNTFPTFFSQSSNTTIRIEMTKTAVTVYTGSTVLLGPYTDWNSGRSTSSIQFYNETRETTPTTGQHLDYIKIDQLKTVDGNYVVGNSFTVSPSSTTGKPIAFSQTW